MEAFLLGHGVIMYELDKSNVKRSYPVLKTSLYTLIV